MKKRLVALLIGLVMLCWMGSAMAAYQIPQRLETSSILPSYVTYRPEYMPQKVAFEQISSTEWMLTLDRNPFENVGEWEIFMGYDFMQTDPGDMPIYELNKNSFIKSSAGYTAKILLPENAIEEGYIDILHCELEITQRKSMDEYVRFTQNYATNDEVNVYIYDENTRYFWARYGQNGWERQIIEVIYDSEQDNQYFYDNNGMTFYVWEFGYYTSAGFERTLFYFYPNGELEYVNYFSTLERTSYFYENDGKGWYYIDDMSRNKVYVGKPANAKDPAEVLSNLKPSEPSDPNATPTNTLAQGPDGKFHYYGADGQIDTTYTNATCEFEGGKFLVINGELTTDVSGIQLTTPDTFYFYANGQVQEVTQLALYDGKWFLVANGTLNEGYTGLYEYDGSLFLITNGWLRDDYTGPWTDPTLGEVQVIEGQVW